MAEPRTSPVRAPPTRMREHFSRLAKQSFVYGLSGAALQVVGLVTFPVLARAFDPSTFGILELALVGFTLALTVVDVGLASATQRSYYDYPEDAIDDRGRVLFTALVATTAVASLLAAIAIVAREPLSQWLFHDSRPRLIALVALTIPVANLAAFLRQVMRLRFRAWHFAISSALSAGLAALIIVVGVTSFDLGVAGVFVGLLVGHVVAVAYGAVVVREQIVAGLSSPELRKMLAFGLPLVPSALAMWALMLVDRLMLGKLGRLSDVGEYAAANRLVSTIVLATTAFATAYGPYALLLYSQDRDLEGRVRARVLVYLTAALTLGALVLSLFGRELLAVLAPGYDEAHRAVALVALGAVALGTSSVTMAGISFARQTRWFALLSIAAALMNVALNLALIPLYGIVGAAAATAVAFGFLTVAYYLVSQRVYPTPYRPGRALVVVAVGAVLAPIGVLRLDTIELELGVKFAALAVFLAALRVLGVVRLSEVRALGAGLLSREARA